MCGILGSIGSDEIKFKNALSTMKHRGPDGERIWRDNDSAVRLGHCRLSIIDLSDSADQPMQFEHLHLIFNGEIFNYLEIKKELQLKGYEFQTKSDSEVLLKAYHCWGKQCLGKFNGMWAFGIYDNASKEFVISRDRYGEKPLYYHHANGVFIFASEVKAIQKLLPSTTLNRHVVSQLASGVGNWHGGAESYLQNISVLPAGHMATFRQGKLSIARWYQLKEQTLPENYTEQVEQFKELVIDACTLRLRSDVAIGTCLSGGVDSGSITAIINKIEGTHYTHQSFCASFPDTPINEAHKAERLARRLDSKLHVINIEAPQPNELESAMRQCDGPMHSLAFYPIWKLYRFIRQSGIIVTLDGQGPDEMLGGYRPLASAIQYGVSIRNPYYIYDVYRTYRAQGETSQFSSKNSSWQILTSTLRNEVGSFLRAPLSKRKNFNHPFRANSFDEELYRQFFSDPLPAILQQYDRCSMASGVECRMPFMDFRLVEFVFSLPPQAKVGHGYTKRILRDAVEGLLPDETRLDKVKIGFNAPIVNWFTGPLKGWMLDWMSSNFFLQTDLFDGKQIRKEFELYIAGDRPQWDGAWRFWGPVHIAWWANQT